MYYANEESDDVIEQVVEGVEKKIELKRQKAKSYYDRSAHPLPQLEVGQEVRVAPLKKGHSWQAGTLVEQLSDRSYLVKTGSDNIRGNRHFLKPKEQSASNTAQRVPSEVTNEQPVADAAAPDPIGNSPNLPDPATCTSSDSVSDIPPDPVPAMPTKCTRTRVVKPPKRFSDFVS